MPTYTPLLKLTQPDFDQDPWDEDINNDLSIIDATVGRFINIAGLSGVWMNSVLYSVGQALVDGDDSSIWTCAITHTSGADPSTFAQERATHPDYWVVNTSSTQEYADAAAASAAAAATSASAAAASAASAANKVPLAGGTMTGPLVLSGAPTVVNGAATKGYVDNATGGSGYLPLAGGTMTGLLTLSGNPTTALQAVPKQYADTKLPLAGGTITGNLTIGGGVTGIRYIQGTHTHAFSWDGTNVSVWVDGSNVGNIARGNYLPLTGGAVSGPITAPEFIVSSSNAYIYSDANYTYFVQDSAGWYWRYTRSTGAMTYIRGSDGIALMAISPNGDLTVPSTMYSPAFSVVTAPDFSIYMQGHSRRFQFEAGWYWNFDDTNGNLIWTGSFGNGFGLTVANNYLENFVGSCAGFGAYVNLSDASTKSDVTETSHGLDTLMQLKPVSFVRNGKTKIEMGFVAQDVQAVLPEAVYEGLAMSDKLGVALDPIVAVLVNAVKELQARIAVLETK